MHTALATVVLYGELSRKSSTSVIEVIQVHGSLRSGRIKIKGDDFGLDTHESYMIWTHNYEMIKYDIFDILDKPTDSDILPDLPDSVIAVLRFLAIRIPKGVKK